MDKKVKQQVPLSSYEQSLFAIARMKRQKRNDYEDYVNRYGSELAGYYFNNSQKENNDPNSKANVELRSLEAEIANERARRVHLEKEMLKKEQDTTYEMQAFSSE